ncbi:MAG: CHC2 zinc finger domain-containing protein [Actinomycetota bacterium]|nr:CHC2 zinc finger domain-containing protein [Actinomycetota bacterium]
MPPAAAEQRTGKKEGDPYADQARTPEPFQEEVYMTTNTTAATEPRPPTDSFEHRYGFKMLLQDVTAQIPPLEGVANDLGAELRPSGEDLRGKGVCHAGDNQSALLVEPDRQRWWCFRCDAGGDLLDLWMAAKGFSSKTDALLDLAGAYGVEPTPRPASFFAKQRRQASARDAIDREKVEHVRDLLFALVWKPWLSRLPEETRGLAFESAWKASLTIARGLYETRRGRVDG